MRYLAILLVIFLPLHALLITTLKCKFGIDTDIFRFWKEGILIILFLTTVIKVLIDFKWNISKIYKNNYILGMTTLFVLFSFAFIFLPFFEPKLSSYLGFKYDVFFLFALVVGLYLPAIKNNFETILKSIFGITGLILVLFLPWYIFGDISSTSSIFGFSDKPSTYEVNSCISFSQNVENGINRFQGSFSGPIRWSVFLTIFYLIYLGYILNKLKITKILTTDNFSFLKILLLLIPSIFVIISVFFSYSKTSVLGLFFGISFFSYIVFKIKLGKKISVKFISIFSALSSIGLILLLIIKREVFLHLGSIINRFDNIITSIEMFLWNPIGYGLGIAGPASWTGSSIESAGSWQIAVVSTSMTHKFLPENWFLQILLEQGFIGLTIFVSLMIIIGVNLYNIVKKKKDYLSIGIFTSFITLLFMANFTHALEESATSYILFLIIGAYITKNKINKIKK